MLLSDASVRPKGPLAAMTRMGKGVGDLEVGFKVSGLRGVGGPNATGHKLIGEPFERLGCIV